MPAALNFTELSYFLQTEVPIRSEYNECKACPYRFVPQTSYSAEQFDRGLRGSGFPRRSRFFVVGAGFPIAGAGRRVGSRP
jgi:hypothetical protein